MAPGVEPAISGGMPPAGADLREACEPTGDHTRPQFLLLTEEELPVRHPVRDPQVDLVRRYARILRSAPAEALRLQKNRTLATAARAKAPLAMTDQARAATASAPRASAPPQ